MGYTHEHTGYTYTHTYTHTIMGWGGAKEDTAWHTAGGHGYLIDSPLHTHTHTPHSRASLVGLIYCTPIGCKDQPQALVRESPGPKDQLHLVEL